MLFSYHNVWNTCLLILRERGYRLFLVGSDEPELISHCTWNAERAGIMLRADNPIELLGLAAILEYHQPIAEVPYWWRVDGPSIVEELQAAWLSQLASVNKTESDAASTE